MNKSIYSRAELIQLLGSDTVEDLEERGLAYQTAAGRYLVDLRDLPADLGLFEEDEDDDEEEDVYE